LLIAFSNSLLQRFGNSVAIKHREDQKQKLARGCLPQNGEIFDPPKGGEIFDPISAAADSGMTCRAGRST
jgi:hypothetical protein